MIGKQSGVTTVPEAQNAETVQWTATALALLVAAGSLWYWSAWTLASNDTAWLLRGGQYILANGKLPDCDLFSWTCHDKEWLLYQWLFEVWLALLGQVAHRNVLWFAGLATSVIAGITYFFLLPRQWQRLGLPLSVVFPFAALALSPPCFFIRPQLISNLLIPIFIDACERFRLKRDWHHLWYLPVLMAAWANVHPLWLVGLGIVAIYVIPVAIGRQDRPHSAGWQAPAILALCAIAVLLNPYGARLAAYEWYFNSQTNFKAVNELKPLWDNPSFLFYPFLIFLGVAWSIMLSKRRAVPPQGMILSGIGTLAAIAMNKLASAGALLVWPYLGMALAGIKSSKGGKQMDEPDPAPDNLPMPADRRQEALWYHCTGALLAMHPIDRFFGERRSYRLFAFACLLSLACYETRIPNADYATTVFAYNDVRIFRFMAEHKMPSERIFNDEPTGSLLIYFHVLPVFCDGRVDFYGRKFCDGWLACINGDPGWQAYLDRYRISHILIRNGTGLSGRLGKSPDWIRCCDSGLRSLWLRNDQAGRATIAQWQHR